MTPSERQRFDELLEEVLPQLPPQVLALLDEIPLIVEDHPSAQVLRQQGLRRRDELCGLYNGVPLIERSVEQFGYLSDTVTIYREGILRAAADCGQADDEEIKRQIRITILHELGHHHGLDEDDLDELGYG